MHHLVISISGHFRTAPNKNLKLFHSHFEHLSFSKTFQVLENCVINLHNFPKPVRTLHTLTWLIKKLYDQVISNYAYISEMERTNNHFLDYNLKTLNNEERGSKGSVPRNFAKHALQNVREHEKCLLTIFI